MIVEMRTYRTKPGLRDQFLTIFEKKVAPIHKLLGMPVSGPFPCMEDEDVFFFTRSFADMQSRSERKALFYEGAAWKSELEDILLPMLDRYDVAIIELSCVPQLIAENSELSPASMPHR